MMIFASWWDINEENESIKVGKYFKNMDAYYKWCEKMNICDDECDLEEVDSDDC